MQKGACLEYVFFSKLWFKKGFRKEKTGKVRRLLGIFLAVFLGVGVFFETSAVPVDFFDSGEGFTWTYLADKLATAMWQPRTIQCPAGKYLNGQTAECDSCLAGYYCPNDAQYVYKDGVNQGLVACPLGYDNNTLLGKKTVSECTIKCSAGTYAANVPEQYRFYESLRISNGYIDTGYKPTPDTEIQAEINPMDTGGFYYWGTGPTSNTSAYNLFVVNNSGTTRFAGGTATVLYSELKSNVYQTIIENRYGVFVDGQQVTTFSAGGTPVNATDTLWLFKTNPINTSYNSGSVSVKRVIIRDGGTVKFDFVPVYDSSSNAYGLYDLIAGRFYKIMGTSASVDGTVASQVCLPCPSGYACSGGTFKFDSDKPQGLTICKAGTYSVEGATTCSVCDMGTYSDFDGAGACKLCSAGTYNDKTGQTSCVACASGSYQDKTGQTVCLACQNGKNTSGVKSSTCDSTCSNIEHLATWQAVTWTPNAVSNICRVETCVAGYLPDLTNNTCVAVNYKLAFNAGGGSGTMADETLTYDVGYVLPSNTAFTNGVKRFVGWTINDKLYKSGETVINLTDKADATVVTTATWEDCAPCDATNANCLLTAPQGVCTYTTTCKAGYYSISGDGTATATCLACTKNSTTPDKNKSKTCSCNTGYSADGTQKGKVAVSGSDVCNPITYNITYNLNNGVQATSGVPTTYTYTRGATIDGVPTLAKSTFIGWCTDSALTNCAMTQTINSADIGDKVYYAKWAQCDACVNKTGSASCDVNVVNNVCVYTNKCSGGYATPVCDGINCSCSVCGNGTYSAGGDAETCTACPSATEHKRTTFPENYYSPTISSTSLSGMGNGSKDISQCRVLTWMSGSRGRLYEYANYNSVTGKYDSSYAYGWSDVNAGYYLTTKAGCGAYAYYKDVKECESGSYCPGKAHVTCNATNKNEVHTETFGRESCPSGYDKSPNGATAANQCYATLSCGTRVATAESNQFENCATGSYLASHNVNYGEISPNCVTATAGTYVSNDKCSVENCPSGYTTNVGASSASQCYETHSVSCEHRTCPANATCEYTDVTTQCTTFPGDNTCYVVNPYDTQLAQSNGVTSPEWGLNYSSGTSVIGNAICSSTTGTANERRQDVSRVGGANCWCKTTNPSDDGLQWVYLDYTGCSSTGQDLDCAYHCSKNATWVIDLRKALYQVDVQPHCDMQVTCNVGTIRSVDANGNVTCTPCPNGYTADAGATDINQCYIIVPAGHEMTTPRGTSANIRVCMNGKYKGGMYKKNTNGMCGDGSSERDCPDNYDTAYPDGYNMVYYGGTVACDSCDSRYPNTNASTNNHYDSAHPEQMATKAEQCYFDVAAGYKYECIWPYDYMYDCAQTCSVVQCGAYRDTNNDGKVEPDDNNIGEYCPGTRVYYGELLQAFRYYQQNHSQNVPVDNTYLGRVAGGDLTMLWHSNNHPSTGNTVDITTYPRNYCPEYSPWTYCAQNPTTCMDGVVNLSLLQWVKGAIDCVPLQNNGVTANIYNSSPLGASTPQQCYAKVECGTRVTTANADTKQACDDGYYLAAHNVNYGNTSPQCVQAAAGQFVTPDKCGVDTCPDGFTTDVGATSIDQCCTQCEPGDWFNPETKRCEHVGAHYWGAGGRVCYGQTLPRNACGTYISPDGSQKYQLKTMGWGEMASSEDDCCMWLRTRDKQKKIDTFVPLCPKKNTAPALAVQFRGFTAPLYGKMTDVSVAPPRNTIESDRTIAPFLWNRDKQGRRFWTAAYPISKVVW